MDALDEVEKEVQSHRRYGPAIAIDDVVAIIGLVRNMHHLSTAVSNRIDGLTAAEAVSLAQSLLDRASELTGEAPRDLLRTGEFGAITMAGIAASLSPVAPAGCTCKGPMAAYGAHDRGCPAKERIAK